MSYLNDFIPSLWQWLYVCAMTLLLFPLGQLVQYFFLHLNSYNLKPFTCRLCTTFWTGIFIYTTTAYMWSPLIMLYGVIATALVCYAIYYDNKNF